MTSPDGTRQSERRHATVLFADISGFTALSEQLDPEVVTSVLNRCYETLERIVLSHGGIVAQYQGDCMLALFGVPRAIENAPKQAVNAAIEIRNRLREFDDQQQQLPVRLDVHMGLNTGLVVAGEIGGHVKRDFSVMGDAVNVAARLKDVSPRGQIYVGHDTYYATNGEFEYRPLKPLTLKGKKEPVPAYELLSRQGRIHRPKIGAAFPMISSAMIGRERELAQIQRRLDALLGGEGGILGIMGDAGIGKSRLVAEVEALEVVKSTTFVVGRSLAIGQNLSFHPFVDLLRHWAGIGDDDSEAQHVVKLERAVAGAGAPISDVVPFIATLMGIRLSGEHGERVRGIDGEALEKLTLKSLRQLFEKTAARQPLVLVFEDVHWADQSSITLLEGMLRLTADAAVLMVIVSRPDFPRTSGRIVDIARQQYADRYQELHLAPLDDQQCDVLVRNLLRIEDLPRATRILITSTAEGNPFFIEEIVRSLIDEGAVESRDGRLHVTEMIHAVVIPATIQEVIMARIDRLHESARSLLQVASVIGRNFSHRVIGDVAGPAVAVDQDLARLHEAQLIIERPVNLLRQAAAAPEREYQFTHALVQDTIYESILQQTRKDLHLRVGRAIESLYHDRLADFFGMLAYHYSRAESIEKAEEYLFKAGDAAARTAASSEALQFFEEAARVYVKIHGAGGDPQRRALLEKNIGLALLNTGKLTESIEHFDAALVHLGQRLTRSRIAAYAGVGLNLIALVAQLYLRVRVQRRVDDWNRERQVSEIIFNRSRAQITSDPTRLFFDSIAALRRFNAIDATQIEQASTIYASAAGMFCYSGLSFAVGKRILTIAKTLSHPDNVRDTFTCAWMEFVYHYLTGDWSETRVIAPQRVEEALRFGQLWDVATYIGLLGEQHIDQGRFAEARQQIAKCTELVTQYGFDFAKSSELALTAYLLMEQRDLAAALTATERYHAARSEGLFNLLALGTKAKIHVLMGDHDRAEHALRAAEQLAAPLGLVPPFHQRPYLIARLLLALTQLEQAQRTGDRSGVTDAMRRAGRLSRRVIRTSRKLARMRPEAFRLLGRYHWLIGKPTTAIHWWGRSIQEGERLRVRPELARTCMDAGHALSTAPDSLPAINGLNPGALLERARSLFTEMDLQWDLKRLAALQPALPQNSLRIV